MGAVAARYLRRGLTARLARIREGRLVLRDGADEFAFEGTAGPVSAVHVDVYHPRFYARAALGGSLGAADAFLDGDWSCDNLTALFRLFLRNPQMGIDLDGGLARGAAWLARVAHILRDNTLRGSRRNIEAHYDLGNEFFRLFLDETMFYSSGIFPHPGATLREASLEKVDRICRKLDLRRGDRVIEIGTGWGGFALHAAGEYGCHVTTATISPAQHALACERVRQAGLEGRVTVVLKDYRDLAGKFDKLASIEMIEAVGHRYLPGFFRRCATLLERDGLMCVQAITMNEQGYDVYLRSVDFIQKYIFPGGCLPSLGSMIGAAARASDLRVLEIEDFAPHYARTLREWSYRFERALDEVRKLGFSERFIRMWRYYFAYCEAAFEERATGLAQVIFARPECRNDPVAGARRQAAHDPAREPYAEATR